MQGYPTTVWPGYTTSIRNHEHDILVCAEVTHKIMRDQTVRDVLQHEFQRDRTGYKENAQRVLLGQVVLTAYNNKTYRISDIDFDQSPLSTFDQKGTAVSFVQYYKQVGVQNIALMNLYHDFFIYFIPFQRWSIEIRDQQQPLLVIKAKAKDQRGGQSDTSLLVPELCYTTGITDREKSDFKYAQQTS